MNSTIYMAANVAANSASKGGVTGNHVIDNLLLLALLVLLIVAIADMLEWL